MKQSITHLAFLIIVVHCVIAVDVIAQNTNEFIPEPGLDGKDVTWVGTPPAMLEKVLDLAQLTPDDYLVDLGSGDGRIVIMAAKRGAKAHGIEYNPELVALSMRFAAKEGIADKASFTEADIFRTDFSRATVLTMYLLPELNLRLRPKILKMRPGTRIVSNTFGMGAWKPDKKWEPPECVNEDHCAALFWIVPANVQGRWQLGDKTLSIQQRFQEFTGWITANHEAHQVYHGRIRGDEIRFEVDSQRYVGRVQGGVMSGSLYAGGSVTEWRATKHTPGQEGQQKTGRSFRDCAVCPTMVVVPSGSFVMGSPPDEQNRFDNEGPQHEVTIPKQFAVSRFEVTFAEWDACVEAKGCNHRPSDVGWGRGRRPVINVSWNDIQEYLSWITRRTGKVYRLLSEAEWEFAARAGTTTTYWCGSQLGTNQANCSDCAAESLETTSLVGSFRPNAYGLYDVHGNVWEWVEDPWHDGYRGAPTDGSVWVQSEDNYFRVIRGGSWEGVAQDLRVAYRISASLDDRYNFLGFRIARTLE